MYNIFEITEIKEFEKKERRILQKFWRPKNSKVSLGIQRMEICTRIKKTERCQTQKKISCRRIIRIYNNWFTKQIFPAFIKTTGYPGSRAKKDIGRITVDIIQFK